MPHPLTTNPSTSHVGVDAVDSMIEEIGDISLDQNYGQQRLSTGGGSHTLSASSATFLYGDNGSSAAPAPPVRSSSTLYVFSITANHESGTNTTIVVAAIA